MKTIEVVAAIIKKEDKVFATQRGYGEFAGGWEFPGGKVELNETREEAIVREIKEELDANVEVVEFFETAYYDYPNFHLTMHCYICKLLSDDIILKEHSDAKWLSIDELDSVGWLPADVGVVDKLKRG